MFSIGGFIEAAFWGQMNGFTPLHLPHLGVAEADVNEWVGLITAL